jgi:multiple sugar transport system substrate-binding protein
VHQAGPWVVYGSGSGTTIVWLTGPTSRTASDDARHVLIDAFEQAYPAIKVDLVSGPDSTNRLHDLLFPELSSGHVTPDVYSGDVIWPAEFAHAGLALPLSKYLPESFWAEFAAPGTPRSGNSLVQSMSYHGNVYAVPYFLDEGFLYYRKDLLARAGLRPPVTWEQLVRDSRVLKKKGLPYQFVWQGNNYEGLTCDWIEITAR